MKMIDVIARPWRGGWELELDPENITQVRRLSEARQQVVDYLDTVEPKKDHSSLEVTLVPEIGPLGAQLREARSATLRAAEMQATAAQQARQVVAALRSEHFSGSDIAELLGVTPGRVSQLLSK